MLLLLALLSFLSTCQSQPQFKTQSKTPSKLLNSTTLYFHTPNRMYFETSRENMCEDVKCELQPESYFCKKCDIRTYDIIWTGSNSSGVSVWTTMYTKPFNSSNPVDIYSYWAYNLYTTKIYRINSEYLVTNDALHFEDGSSKGTGNFVHITFYMGYNLS